MRWKLIVLFFSASTFSVLGQTWSPYVVPDEWTPSAIRYVNAASDGSASNPTRAFDHPSYTANDSYKTLSAAYSAASNGEEIQLSGGTLTNIYAPHTGQIAKQLIVRGSRIPGHDGVVLFTNGSSTVYMQLNHGNTGILDRVEIDCKGVAFGLRLWDNALVKNVKIRGLAGTNPNIQFSGTQTNHVAHLMNVVLEKDNQDNSVSGANAISSVGWSGSNVWYGCTLVGAFGNTANSGVGTRNIANGCLFGPSALMQSTFAWSSLTNGNWTFYNCGLMGTWGQPQNLFNITGGGSVTDGGGNLVNPKLKFKSVKPSTAFWSWNVDDLGGRDYATNQMRILKDNHNQRMTWFVDDTTRMSSADTNALRWAYLNGHEIASHTAFHCDMASTNCFNIKYTGAGANPVVQVTAGGNTLTLTCDGGTDQIGPLDLTTASYDTALEVQNEINASANWDCVAVTNGSSTAFVTLTKNLPSTVLKVANTSVSASFTGIPFDDVTGASNRWYVAALSNSFLHLEGAIRSGGAEYDGYRCRGFGWPYNTLNQGAMAWVTNHMPQVWYIRANNSSIPSTTVADRALLSSNNLFSCYQAITSRATMITNNTFDTAMYAGLSDANKEVRIRKATRAFGQSALVGGLWLGMLNHSVAGGDLTSDEFTWAANEMALFETEGLYVGSFVNCVTNITTSGNWTQVGTTPYWRRDWTGVNNFIPLSSSDLYNTGILITNRTNDVRGRSIGSSANIGAYESGSKRLTIMDVGQ